MYNMLSHSVVSDSLSPPGSSVHGILQAKILQWVAILFSRGSSQPRDQTQVSCIAGRFFTVWTTWEAPRYFRRTLFSRKWGRRSFICHDQSSFPSRMWFRSKARRRLCFHLSKPLQGEPHPHRHRVSPVTSPEEREQVFDPSDSLIKSLFKFNFYFILGV